MFESTHPFLFFDYFRVPYRSGRIEPVAASSDSPHRGSLGRITADGSDEAPYIAWPVDHAGVAAAEGASLRGRFWLGTASICGEVLSEAALRSAREPLAGRWSAGATIHDVRGRPVSSVWHEASGSVLLPFDPSEAVSNLWSESYRSLDGNAVRELVRRGLTRSYYALRPLIPRPAQIKLRRAHSRIQARTAFPRWPIENGLHALYSLLFQLFASVAGQPVPWLSAWPAPHSWALVLTHDVETQLGYDNIRPLQALEARKGYRSSWNLVPKRYEIDDDDVADFAANGFEVGVHGLYHDGLDLSPKMFYARLPEMQAAAKRWDARGFRSPSTRRDRDRVARLGFDYDSSYPDTDPFEPDPGGCCSWLPFFHDRVVELPITLPQDHTLFVILERPDEKTWIEKAEYLKSRGGMALVLTHPDYLVEAGPREAYGRFLERFADDADAWRPLPCEVSAWWRRRAASSPEPAGGGWRVEGPAAGEAEVRLAELDGVFR